MISSLDVFCRSVSRQEAEDVSAHTEASGPFLLSSIHTFFLSQLREIESQSCTFYFPPHIRLSTLIFFCFSSAVGFFSPYFLQASLFTSSTFFLL